MDQNTEVIAEISLLFERVYLVVGHEPEDAKSMATKTLAAIGNMALILLLTEKKDLELIEKIKNSKEGVDWNRLIQEKFDPKKVTEAFMLVTKDTMTEYFKNVYQSLDFDSQEKLNKLMEEYV